MIPPIQQALLERLARICELTPDIRFGQMMDMMGFLSEDFGGQSLGVVEDEALLAVAERHLADLTARGSTTQPAMPPETDKAVAARPTMPIFASIEATLWRVLRQLRRFVVRVIGAAESFNQELHQVGFLAGGDFDVADSFVESVPQAFEADRVSQEFSIGMVGRAANLGVLRLDAALHSRTKRLSNFTRLSNRKPLTIRKVVRH